MKTLSLTNLDRITELDFNKNSNVGSVGGSLSITKFKNLEVLKAAYNDLNDISFSTDNNVTVRELDLSNNLLTAVSNLGSLTSLETLDLSNNSLPLSEVDEVLTALDTIGLSNGTVQLVGTNSIPTLGNYNTEKLSLESKGWTVGIAGGIDTSFDVSEGYTDGGHTANHPDWEGSVTTWQINQGKTFKNETTGSPPVGKITTTGDYVNLRTAAPIRSKVGDTITVSLNYDYGNDDDSPSFTTDTTNPPQERTILIALADVGPFSTNSAGVLANYPTIALMAKFISFQNSASNPAYLKLYQKYSAVNGNHEIIVGENSWQPLADVGVDNFTFTMQIQIGESKETSTVTITMVNDIDGNSLTGSYTLASYSEMYDAFVSPDSDVKLCIQSGKLSQTGIDNLNIYSATARVN